MCIRDRHNIGHGVIARKIYEDWFTRTSEFASVLDRWNLILTDPTHPCTFDINGEEIYGHYYFPARCFNNPEFAENMLDWLAQEYDMPKTKVDQEREYQIIHGTVGKKLIKGLSVIDYTKDYVFHKNNASELVDAYRLYIDSGNTQRAKKRLFGLI